MKSKLMFIQKCFCCVAGTSISLGYAAQKTLMHHTNLNSVSPLAKLPPVMRFAKLFSSVAVHTHTQGCRETPTYKFAYA